MELQIGRRLLIVNQLGRSYIMVGQSQMGTESDHIFITLLWQVMGFVVPFTSSSKQGKIAGPKSLCWARPTCFDFSSSNFQFAESHTRALVELLWGRGFECAWPIGIYFWVWREHGSTFFMRLALWHIEMHPLLVDNVNLVNAQYSKANSSKKEHVKIVKKQKKTSCSKMWYDHQKLGECCYYCLNVNLPTTWVVALSYFSLMAVWSSKNLVNVVIVVWMWRHCNLMVCFVLFGHYFDWFL